MNLRPVILAGGSGTRLWPLSREQYPKQLLSLHGAETLLQQTARRAEALAGVDVDLTVLPPVVVCAEEQRFLIAEQLRQVGCEGAHIVLEPLARNTAPALTFAALACVADGDDPVMLVMPADHVVADVDAFKRAAWRGIELARAGSIGTLGIVPDRPETGFGYVRTGKALPGRDGEAPAFELARFVEKPDEETAREYLAGGEHLWNSGMFILRASVWLKAIGLLQPKIDSASRESCSASTRDGSFVHLAPEPLSACPSDSIDYAVMEPLTQGGRRIDGLPGAVVVPLDAGWSDVGAWSALLELKQADADPDGNVMGGDVIPLETRNSLLLSESRLLATVGVSDLVVVETPDAVLVAHKDRAQDVKEVVGKLKARGRSEGRMHRRVYRPWGSYEGLDNGERYQVKRLTVNPGEAISLQLHHHRAEHWVVVRGTARVTRGEETFLLTENQSTYIPLGTVHRLENPGKVPLHIVEVQSGGYLGEDDIVRFEDRYRRDNGNGEPC